MSVRRTREPQKIPVSEIARGLACDSRVRAKGLAEDRFRHGPRSGAGPRSQLEVEQLYVE
jgi:hypothetical protein